MTPYIMHGILIIETSAFF